MNLRYIAACVISEVLAGKSLATVLPLYLPKLESPKDQAFVQAVSFGVCRYYVRLHFYLQQLLQKPLKAKEKKLLALMLVGLYQLTEMRVREHAAVSETVAASKYLKLPWAKGLINAILREFLRKKMELQAQVVNQVDAYYAHPFWWIEKLKLAYPTEWQSILSANNELPPFAIRVVGNPEDYLSVLHNVEISAHAIPHTESGLIVEKACGVDALPGFKEGKVIVQDGAAQLAAPLLDLKEGLRVLDACSAPGGKLLHILAKEPALGEVIAVEKDRDRLTKIEENITRLYPQLKNSKRLQLKLADALAPDTWWDKQLFDRILLDVPCSASGVIRRHPDIKLLRQPADLSALAHTQLQMLSALWRLLKPRGILLYVTCSIFPDENQEVISAFMKEREDCLVAPLPLSFGKACKVGTQILPGSNEMDGFYYCLLRKY